MNTLRPPVRSCVGFTLTELLVTIAVIAIVVVISIAGVQRSIRASYSGRCIQNLKQIGVGTQIYLTDHNNRIFPEMRPNRPGQDYSVVDRSGYWLQAIRDALDIPYTSAAGAEPQGPVENVFICPAHPTRGGRVKYGAPAGNGVSGDESVTGFRARSYIPNRYVLNIHLFDMPERSRVILFADFPWEKQGTRAFWRGDAWSNNLPMDWHQGMINCLFADLHVEPVVASSLRLWASNDRLWHPNYPNLPWPK